MTTANALRDIFGIEEEPTSLAQSPTNKPRTSVIDYDHNRSDDANKPPKDSNDYNRSDDISSTSEKPTFEELLLLFVDEHEDLSEKYDEDLPEDPARCV